MDESIVLKPKSLKEIKSDFRKILKKLFLENGIVDQQFAFNLISNIVKLVPDEDKQQFARDVVFETIVISSNNEYDAIGILEFAKSDLMSAYKESENSDNEEQEEQN